MTSKTRQLTEAEWKYSASDATAEPFYRGSPPLWVHVVTWNLRKRRINRGHIEPRYVAISGNGGDYIFYLGTGAPEPESPVVALGPGLDYAILAPDFNAFAIACFNETLRYFSRPGLRDPLA